MNIGDKWIWHFDKKGYSICSGSKTYINAYLREAQPSSNIMAKVWKRIWKMKVPNKIKFFWRALNEIIPTNYNLWKSGVNVDLTCSICNAFPESTDHALFSCSRAKNVWARTAPQVDCSIDFNNRFRDRWLSVSSSCFDEELDLIAITCWAIWNDRNSACSGKQLLSSDLRSVWILCYSKEFRKTAT